MPFLVSTLSTTNRIHNNIDSNSLENHGNRRIFFASTVAGLEDILFKELLSIDGVLSLKRKKCGVEFIGDDKVGFESLMWLRTPLKLMELIKTQNAVIERNDLYDMCQSIDWSKYLSFSSTFKCDTVLGQSVGKDLSHSHYTSLTVKNSIVDQFRNNVGSRPNVDIDNPDVSLHLYLHKDTAKLYRSWSGSQSMHKRGYRDTIHKAALRETIASAILFQSQWNPKTEILADVMCGSGTILIEAALMLCNTAPGLIRYKDTLPDPLKWTDVSKKTWEQVLLAAASKDKRLENTNIRLIGNDINESALELAKQSSVKAGVSKMIQFSCSDTMSFSPNIPVDIVVTNPPWDIRLTEGAEGSWNALRLFKKICMSNKPVWTLCGNDRLLNLMKQKPKKELKFSAASLELTLSEF